MVNRCDAVEFQELTAWAQQAAQELNLQPLHEDDVDTVLVESAQISGELVRSAGPVAMYFAGLLLAAGHVTDVATACQMASRLMRPPGADQER